jgi:hypothetical protein
MRPVAGVYNRTATRICVAGFIACYHGQSINGRSIRMSVKESLLHGRPGRENVRRHVLRMLCVNCQESISRANDQGGGEADFENGCDVGIIEVKVKEA